jgi:hypothetical protein
MFCHYSLFFLYAVSRSFCNFIYIYGWIVNSSKMYIFVTRMSVSTVISSSLSCFVILSLSDIQMFPPALRLWVPSACVLRLLRIKFSYITPLSDPNLLPVLRFGTCFFCVLRSEWESKFCTYIRPNYCQILGVWSMFWFIGFYVWYEKLQILTRVYQNLMQLLKKIVCEENLFFVLIFAIWNTFLICFMGSFSCK